MQHAIDYGSQTGTGSDPLEVDRGLEETLLTEAIKAQRYCKSEHLRDYRIADRSMRSSLSELEKVGKFVLSR